MMKKLISKFKKRGFTLVELLAVIVILAVVILIAVTAVIPRMNSAKKNALVDEALMYLNAAKESYIFNDETPSSCINISDLNEKYIQKASNTYQGVIKTEYTDGKVKQTINLTNGKLYLVGSDNPSKNDVKSSMPNGFATSCGDYNPVIADNADTNTLAYKLLMNEGGSTIDANLETINTRSQNVNFTNLESDASNSGLYKVEDNDGASYLYRGNVSNNWVEFAGFYWKVVRINGDGSIRMIYTGLKNSNHTGANAVIKTIQFSDPTNYSVQTPDISGLTNTNVNTSYSNGRFTHSNVGYMYNPSKILSKYPQHELSSSKNLSVFPIFSNIDNTKEYYLFKNFDFENDCFTGSGNDEEASCTLKCRSLGDDCILTNWNTHATTEGNYSTTETGIYPTSNPTQYVYTSDYKYSCWLNSTPVTKNNSDGTTSVYVSCPLVTEIIGTVKNQTQQAKVIYHGVFSPDEASAYMNNKDSRIKIELESWYENNIYNKKDGTDASSRYLEEYIADEMFCNDRSATKSGQEFPLTRQNTYYFDSYTRINGNSKTPSLKCTNKSRDGFTLGSSTSSIVSPKNSGNNLLKYPVGLITVDEVNMAGAVNGTSNTNTNLYLRTGSNFWTMSPYVFSSNNGYAYIWYVSSQGILSSYQSNSNYGVRPVINLKASVLYDSGSGTEADPYTVKLSA